MSSPPTNRPHPAWYSPPEPLVPGGTGWNIRDLAPQAEELRVDAPPRVRPPSAAGASPSRVRRLMYAAAGGLTAALAAAALGFVVQRGYEAPHTISQPAQLGAFKLMPVQTSAAQVRSAAAVAEVEALGATQVLVGAYGTGGRQQLLLVVARSRAPVDTGLSLLSKVAAGTAAAGWKVNTSAANGLSRDGVEYACAPSSQPRTPPATLCAWGDVDVIGLVVDQTSTAAEAAADAAAARAAAES